MEEFDGFDMEVRMAERDDDEENPWTDEDQAAYIAHIEDPLVYADIERREAEFLAWARTQNWAMTSEAITINRIASTVSQLSQVVGAPSRAANPAHHTQVGGSEDSESADSDSHVLAYHQHLKSLAIWTSALEVISAILPLAKSIKKKHTYQIGNLRLDLSDYPADFTPDYAAPTLLLAAKLSGFADDEHALFGLLDDVLGHHLWQIYTRFQRPLRPTTVVYPVVVDDSNGLPAYLTTAANLGHADIDLAQIARKLDRDGGLHRLVVRVSKRVCGVWAADKTFGDDILHDVTTATYCSLLQKCRSDASTAQVAAYSSEWARSHLRDVLRRLKITIPKRQVQKRLSLAEAVLARHDTTAPMDGAVSAAWDAHRTKLQADVDKYKTTIGGSMVVGVDSLVALLSDAEGSISEVDTLISDIDSGGSLESAAVIADVRNLFTGPVISDLLEKLSIVSKSTMGCEDHPLEFLAGVISQNKKALAIIKNSIGPDGLAQLARHI